MLKAYSLQTRAVVRLPRGKPGSKTYILQRRDGAGGGGPWLTLAEGGEFAQNASPAWPLPVNGSFLDEALPAGICQYRAREAGEEGAPWDYSAWLRAGGGFPVGYTYGNYQAPPGEWGEALTADDLRGYLWGVDFRASNGESYTDEQIRFFISSAAAEMERLLNITLKKTRVACRPQDRGLEKGRDYDAEEPYYAFKRERMQRSGMINTKKRPVLEVSRVDLVARGRRLLPMLNSAVVDGAKGRIQLMNRLPRAGDSFRGVAAAIHPYGADNFERELFYEVDYVAGFETSDDIPPDLRDVIGKKAAVSLMNVIGRGLMAGFASSSLSMDGMSESFCSTQCATSAFYGADIKEYKDDIATYIAESRGKFGHVVMGAL